LSAIALRGGEKKKKGVLQGVAEGWMKREGRWVAIACHTGRKEGGPSAFRARRKKKKTNPGIRRRERKAEDFLAILIFLRAGKGETGIKGLRAHRQGRKKKKEKGTARRAEIAQGEGGGEGGGRAMPCDEEAIAYKVWQSSTSRGRGGFRAGADNTRKEERRRTRLFS